MESPSGWVQPRPRWSAKAIATELGKLDPANQARYAANLAAFEGKVDALDKVIAVQMKAVDQKGYFVFPRSLWILGAPLRHGSKGHFTVSPGVAREPRR